jgi:hypothetical protein
MAVLDLQDEPTGQMYRDLLAFAGRNSTAVSLVWRLQFGPHGHAVEAALHPWMIRESETQSWPGTELVGDSNRALVRFYQPHPQVLAELAQADGLYAWLASSDRPEDLAFYGRDERYWLGSIAHEREGFVATDLIDVDALLVEVPGLELVRG